MSRKQEVFEYNLTGNLGSPWGYDPHPRDHETFIGWRAIWHKQAYVNGKLRKDYLEYLQDRTSIRGTSADVNRLTKWWTKRGGVESLWLKADAYEPPYTLDADKPEKPLWTYRDEKTGNVAQVRKSYDYVYITLYHDTLKKENT